MPQRTGMTQQQQPNNPCGANRPAYDIAGRVNDLINCYLITFGEFVKAYLPLVLIGIVLLVIMIYAAKDVIDE